VHFKWVPGEPPDRCTTGYSSRPTGAAARRRRSTTRYRSRATTTPPCTSSTSSTGGSSSPPTQSEVVASLEAQGDDALDAAAAQARDAGIEVVTERREGIPHRAIVDYADEAGIDLVAMGTHGRTGRDRLAALGSVTDRVVETTHCPVLVVNIEDGE
jgi:nucleotide-binding universal stress UspA family protein